MRYIAMVLICIVCAVFKCAVFPLYSLFGIEPDIILCCMILMMYFDRTSVSMIYLTITAFAADILFARALGFYALPYAVIGLILYFVFKRLENAKVYVTLIICPIATLLKECLTGFIAVLLRYNINFGYVLLTDTMPLLIINTILTLILIFPLRKLYSANFMLPISSHHDGLI